SSTRRAYELDLCQYASWCQQHHLRLFGACRADIECVARGLETRGRAGATITRRLCTIAGSTAMPSKRKLLHHSPPAHVRRRCFRQHQPTATSEAEPHRPPLAGTPGDHEHGVPCRGHRAHQLAWSVLTQVITSSRYCATLIAGGPPGRGS